MCENCRDSIDRRSFLSLAGVGAAALGAGLSLATPARAAGGPTTTPTADQALPS